MSEAVSLEHFNVLKLITEIYSVLFFRLKRCNFTSKSCGLGLENTRLKTLDLSDNDVQDSGMKQLMNSLKDPSCKLEKLRLCFIYYIFTALD